MEEKEIFTLQKVVLSVKKTIDDRYKRAYWIKAELHKINTFPSGHSFPELVQKENGKIVAQMTGMIWKSVMENITRQFAEIVKQPLKEGTTVLLLAKINFSETYGLSLNILNIDPNYMLGELQRERNETLKKLNEEGLLNANKGLDFPLLPKRIAVISAESSKGLSDFMEILNNNPRGYKVQTKLFQAYLQGDMASKSIREQFKKIKKHKSHFDIVVIVRGGGGEVGMTCYNDYELCKALAEFPLPVLTGIGHSTNKTVAELICYRNAITPTDLADIVLSCFSDFENQLNANAKTLESVSRELVNYQRMMIENTQKNLFSSLKNRISDNKVALKHHSKQILSLSKSQLAMGKMALKKEQTNLLRNSQNVILTKRKEWRSHRELMMREAHFVSQKHTMKLGHEVEKLSPMIQKTFENQTTLLAHVSHRIEMLNPRSVLKRGYSITRVNDKVISTDNAVKKGDKISTFTYDNIIESEVKEIKE
ncbi:MAG: exodeoxyribonuclease VII large subunit [Lentimonas sp.]|jgi:exodeoxyribonuclease VII large subunit